MPRIYADLPLQAGARILLPDSAARHVQVLRMQPGGTITLFNGQPLGESHEGEFEAVIERMGRSDVEVTVGAWKTTARESRRAVHIAVGMPANDRMDWLVEKATELGVASIQPVMAERSVLRLKGERSEKKLAHWRGIAIAASEQCGRNRPPVIHEALGMADWLRAIAPAGSGKRLLLSLRPGAQPLLQAMAGEQDDAPVTFLSGPEGGLSPTEEDAAIAAGFSAVTLGARTLRAETAPLACLALFALD
ncbi:MAG: 16S rRNA (uracil(1498)-N(3))-methyltransferase [Comamonadaceae bacterium]|nr:MAG: 16S rRNA (uracil(1498)-N(3))-methyltransferase [Comamonadaceae bacterium]